MIPFDSFYFNDIYFDDDNNVFFENYDIFNYTTSSYGYTNIKEFHDRYDSFEASDTFIEKTNIAPLKYWTD